MGLQTVVSEATYLSTPYDPDCDYIDGEVLERNLGEERHSYLQAILSSYFVTRRRQWNVVPYTEQRVRVGLRRYRVPDICVVRGGRSPEQVFTQPPFLCIEILSTEDRLKRIEERIADYLKMGVPTVWLIDPAGPKAWIYRGESVAEVTDGVLRTSDPEIYVPIAELLDD